MNFLALLEIRKVGAQEEKTKLPGQTQNQRP